MTEGKAISGDKDNSVVRFSKNSSSLDIDVVLCAIERATAPNVRMPVCVCVCVWVPLIAAANILQGKPYGVMNKYIVSILAMTK